MLAVPAVAQQTLSLQEAVRMSLEKHPALEAAAQQVRVADARIEQAKSGRLPKVNYQESFARSNNPVFVFSSLLTQRQFTEANFQIDTLNRPDFLNNFQSLVTVDQNLWDAGATKNQVAAAEIGRSISTEDERRTRLNTMVRVIESYYGARLAEAMLNTAREAVKSARADLERARSVRDAGMSTDADVLSIQVHLANVQEQEIRRAADFDVARAALNEALGLPLGTAHELTTPLEAAGVTGTLPDDWEKQALEQRPELRQLRLSAQFAEKQGAAARAALYPQFGLRGAFEADRQEFIRKGGANWTIGATMRWNLFNGYADRARIAESSYAAAAARAQERRADAGVRLEVRRAWANLRAADERIKVASASVNRAEESLRIIKNRFETGLTTVTDLLRNETALLDARTRRLSAVYEQRLAAAALELAAGSLSPDSEVLK